MAEIDTTKIIPLAKKFGSWLTFAAGVVGAGVFALQGDYGNAFTAFIAAAAAVGLNLPVHAQVKAAK